MSDAPILKITPDQAKEIPMVDLAFDVLKVANTPFYYRDLMAEIARVKGFTDEEVMQVIAQLYTEINMDGRFACVGNNLWGLKRWYPVEKEGEMGNAKRPRIINDDDDDLDEEEYVEEEEDTYTGDDDFDSFDEDREELPEEEEEEDLFAAEEIDEEIEETEEIEESGDDLGEESEESDFEEDFEDDSDDEDDDK